jgi:lipid-binding SYLF domain-containing protein
MNNTVGKWLLSGALFTALLWPVSPLWAETAAEINAAVASALVKFRQEVKGADEYLQSAKGVLVIPDVQKVGFVVAAQWGTGALRVGGKTVGYYRMDAGSAGFQAGYQKTSFVFIFFTNKSLNKFRESDGWTVGAETGLTMVDEVAGVSVDSLKNSDAVAGFAFGKEGLMGGWSAKGTKFTPATPDK